MKLGHDLEIVHHEYEHEREPEYWYFHLYGETVDDEKTSIRYDSAQEAMQAFSDGSIKWDSDL